MREVVVISGKGGTGKTSITSSLAHVASKEIVLADCDVDASDLHLIFRPVDSSVEDFRSGFVSIIDQGLCNQCGKCSDICRFAAVDRFEGKYTIDTIQCEGCGYCSLICPKQAIVMEEQHVGFIHQSKTRNGIPMAHANLLVGADNSGKLVAQVKKTAKELASKMGIEYILVDGSPGIGCPVISSLSGANLAILVTEPSRSAFNDLKRVWGLTDKFRLPVACIINKADINTDVTGEIRTFLRDKNILELDCISYDDDFHRAITNGISLVEFDPNKWHKRFSRIWESIKEML